MRKCLVMCVMLVLMRHSITCAQQGLPQEPQTMQTRFGPLSVGKDRVLLFRGQALQPRVEGNNSLDLGAPFRMGAADVVLVINEGGTLCPYLYHFVTVTQSGAHATPAFGTCAEQTNVERRGDVLRVSMPGFRGPFESPQDRSRAARERHVFLYRAGVVTEHGQPVKERR